MPIIIAAIIPFLIAVLGLVLFVLPAGTDGSPERKEIGRQLMFCGFFFTVAVVTWKSTH